MDARPCVFSAGAKIAAWTSWRGRCRHRGGEVSSKFGSAVGAPLPEARALLHKVNFLYMPMDFQRQVSFGEVFVNATSPQAALDLWENLNEENEEYQVCWATKVQGLRALIQKYRNFSIMRSDVSDEAKPRLYISGARTPFPAPTKVLARPRTKARAN